MQKSKREKLEGGLWNLPRPPTVLNNLTHFKIKNILALHFRVLIWAVYLSISFQFLDFSLLIFSLAPQDEACSLLTLRAPHHFFNSLCFLVVNASSWTEVDDVLISLKVSWADWRAVLSRWRVLFWWSPFVPNCDLYGNWCRGASFVRERLDLLRCTQRLYYRSSVLRVNEVLFENLERGKVSTELHILWMRYFCTQFLWKTCSL